MTPQNFTITIPANGSATNQQSGFVLTIKTCSLPINVSTDGGAYQPIGSGAVIDLRPSGFSALNFQNPNAVAVNVTFWIADEPVNFSPSDNSAALVSTYGVGNFGQADGAAATGTLPAVIGSGVSKGYGQILSTKTYALASTDPATGSRRQLLFISVDPKSANPAFLIDGSGNSGVPIAIGAQMQFAVDAAFLITGVGGTANVAILQIYLKNN